VAQNLREKEDMIKLLSQELEREKVRRKEVD